jgi:hypothetical protein
MASTLSWICYLSIQTHVTIFKKHVHVDQKSHEIVVQSHTKTITGDHQKRDQFSASILTSQVAPK